MPNIAIYEGGKAARMNGVSRITTDDGNDGKIVWVPQSDRQTGTLYVSENGTYRAEDEGLHSWSKVTVRLAGAPLGLEVPTLPDPITGAEIPTGEIGLEEPVPPAGLEPIEDEPISADEAEKILEEAGLDPSDLESDDALEAIADALGTDPENVKVIDPEKKEDVKKEQPKVEDKGQKATGTDQDTGEPAIITPSGKEGVIEYDELRVITPPSKTSYNDGDTIDYSGIVCALYKDGKFVRNASYDELSFPVPVATYDGEIPEEFTDGDGINAALISQTPQYSVTRKSGGYEFATVYVSPIIGTYHEHEVALGGTVGGSMYMTNYEGEAFAKIVYGSPQFGMYAYFGPYEEGGNESIYEWHAVGGASVGGLSTERFARTHFTNLSLPASTKDPRLEGSSGWWSMGQHQDVPVNCEGLSSSVSIMVKISGQQ